MANVFKKLGVSKKGDRVVIYLPMIPEIGLSPCSPARGSGPSIRSSLPGFLPIRFGRAHQRTATPSMVITADECPTRRTQDHQPQGQCERRRSCTMPDEVEKCLIVTPHRPSRWQLRRRARLRAYHEEADDGLHRGLPARGDGRGGSAVHPLHLRLHRKAQGRGAHHRRLSCVYAGHDPSRYVFDYHDGDIYWCTADVGWVTGHSYIVYGPLANGATDADVRRRAQLSRRVSRFWQVVRQA